MWKADLFERYVHSAKTQLKVTDEFLVDRVQSVHHAADVYELDLFVSGKDGSGSASLEKQ